MTPTFYNEKSPNFSSATKMPHFSSHYQNHQTLAPTTKTPNFNSYNQNHQIQVPTIRITKFQLVQKKSYFDLSRKHQILAHVVFPHRRLTWVILAQVLIYYMNQTTSFCFVHGLSLPTTSSNEMCFSYIYAMRVIWIITSVNSLMSLQLPSSWFVPFDTCFTHRLVSQLMPPKWPFILPTQSFT